MSTAIELDVSPTVEDLLSDLGDVPADRVLLRPAPGTATEADLLRLLEATNKRLVELVDGTLVEKPMGIEESAVASRIGGIIDAYLEEHPLGIVSGSDGPARMFSGNVRLPDVGFFSNERWRTNVATRSPVSAVGPEIAIEVISRSNRPREMARKREEYFASGAVIVWQVYLESETVQVYSDPQTFVELSVNDTLDGGQVLPGLSIPVDAIFRRLRQIREQMPPSSEKE